jgi:hypothetical protein
MPEEILCFTLQKGRSNHLFTPFSLTPRAPNIILKLLKLVHFLVFADLSRLILVELK